MKTAVWVVAAIVAIVLLVGVLGHVLLLAALTGGGFLCGRGYERGKAAITRSRARGSLGR